MRRYPESSLILCVFFEMVCSIKKQSKFGRCTKSRVHHLDKASLGETRLEKCPGCGETLFPSCTTYLLIPRVLHKSHQGSTMALLHRAWQARGSIRSCYRLPVLQHRSLSGREKLLRVSEEVQDALATGKPVVALETTIYTHGKQRP